MIPNGSQAISETMCVTEGEDAILVSLSRTQAWRARSSMSRLWSKAPPPVRAQTAFDVNGNAVPVGWTPTMVLGIPNLLGGSGTQNLTLIFTTRGTAATWNIDDVFVDPFQVGLRGLTPSRIARLAPPALRPGGRGSSTPGSGRRPARGDLSELQSVVSNATVIADARGRANGASIPCRRRHVDSIFAIVLATGMVVSLFLAAPLTIPIGALLASVVAFTVASLIEFEIGPGSAVPATPVMIVALFLLPPVLVPVAAVLGLFGSALIQLTP